MKRCWCLSLGVSLILGLGAIPEARSEVVIDTIDFQQTDLDLAVSFLIAKAEEQSGQKLSGLRLDQENALKDAAITLKLNRVPWAEAMRYTCELAGATWKKEGNVIVYGPAADLQRMKLQRGKIQTGPGSERNEARLAAMKLNSVAFSNSSLEEVAEYLRLMGNELLAKQPGGRDQTFNVLIKENVANPVATRAVSLNLEDISFSELLHYATGMVGCRYRVDARAVVIGEAEDLARPPGGPLRPSGPIFNQLAATQINAIDIPAGTSVREFLEAVQTLGGVNGITLTEDAVAASRLAMENVTALELVRYFNEASGTAFRLDANAFVITDDPAVPKKPKPPEALTTGPASGGTPNGLGFDP